jgi:hypothetical protein
MNCPETIPPTDRAQFDSAVAAIGKDPSTLAVLYVHNMMALSALEQHMRVVETEHAAWRKRAEDAEATVAILREDVQRLMERVDVLGGAA